jgi:hypothetical protein
MKLLPDTYVLIRPTVLLINQFCPRLQPVHPAGQYGDDCVRGHKKLKLLQKPALSENTYIWAARV